MKNPLVSIIIPNYCHARFLNQRIDSILSQTYKNFELIILDDCSTDNSREVIEQYRNNPHVSHIVYNETNTGNTFVQWERGMTLAKGELCYIAESDDFCRPELLEHLVSKFEEDDDVVMARCNTFFADENGEIFYGVRPKENDRIYSSAEFIKKYLLKGNSNYNAGMVLFSREVALKVDKQYQSFKGAGDYMFWVEIAECGKVAAVNEPFNFFRRHEGVVTARRDSDGSNLKAKKVILDYISSKVGLTEEERNEALCYNLREARRLNFDSQEIKEEVEALWAVPDNVCAKHATRSYEHFPLSFRLKQKMNLLVFRLSYDQYAHKYYNF